SAHHLPERGEDPPGVQSNVIGRGGCPTTDPDPCYATVTLPTNGDAHVGWMTSQGHRDNILDPAVTAEGIGVFCGSHGILYATEIFRAAPSNAVEPTTPASPIAEPSRSGLTCDGIAR
ncbi:MAG: CAP domain-containing protein, partial [Acidimicrobiales bacterium]